MPEAAPTCRAVIGPDPYRMLVCMLADAMGLTVGGDPSMVVWVSGNPAALAWVALCATRWGSA